jgi:hypothetical protein
VSSDGSKQQSNQTFTRNPTSANSDSKSDSLGKSAH